ncbi:MAG: CHAT domain-containing protein, partial [Pirellulales bacterium]|nr:CHAT domain-containing protein [Pirellulales bacterium]
MTTARLLKRSSPLLAIVGLLAPWGAAAPAAAQQPQFVSDSIPSGAYFQGIEQLYRGEYRDAGRLFQRELRGGIKIGVTSRWLDSISYHAMLGELLYHQGQPALALEQFNQACAEFLRHSKWMLHVEFKPPQPDANRLNQRPPPWGTSVRKFRLGKFPDQMLFRQGDLYSAERAIRSGGGVVVQPELWRVNVIEIIRSTALAIRRRNELLGPLGEYDPISRALVTTLSQGGAPPNHWANAWVDLQLGLAYVGQGKPALAIKRLQRAERIAGEFDHPLTCVALLEMGRLSMEAGNLEAAQQLLADASISAFYYDDVGIIDESFRLSTMCRLASNSGGVNPALEPAIAWARRERYDHVFVRLCFALTEEASAAGDWQVAATALKTGMARLRDARQGLLGNQAQFLQGRLLLQEGHELAHDTLLQAVGQHVGMSAHNLQLLLANARYDERQLQTRSAVKVYQKLLGDPEPADWVFRPLPSLSMLKTPHHAAFERWLSAVPRKDLGKALEITDLAKRHRYLQSLSWGGRLAALRDTLEAPDHLLSQHARGQRNEILLRFPEYAEARKAGRELQAQIRTDWKRALDNRADRDLVKVWRRWDANLNERERMLHRLGAWRVPADIQFPAVVPTDKLQAQLRAGQAVAVFHDTSDGLQGFLLSAKSAKRWNCGPSGRIASLLRVFLRDLGNYDAHHELSASDLASQQWLESGGKLFEALFDGSSIDPESMTDLLVVPDGLTWYVPWAALPVSSEQKVIRPLITTSRIRVSPLVGVAFADRIPLRRVQRTGIAGRAILPGQTDAEQEESLAVLRDALENPFDLDRQLPVANPTVGSLLETLVVLDDVEIDLAQPLDWSPIPQGRSARESSLGDWLHLPQFGPQRVILPATHTVAERGGKVSRRKSAATTPPGTELFLASCGLMSTGAQTILLSHWQVGGESTLEILREFMQELPHTTAADAWQRSVQLVRELPIEAASERRV